MINDKKLIACERRGSKICCEIICNVTRTKQITIFDLTEKAHITSQKEGLCKIGNDVAAFLYK